MWEHCNVTQALPFKKMRDFAAHPAEPAFYSLEVKTVRYGVPVAHRAEYTPPKPLSLTRHHPGRPQSVPLQHTSSGSLRSEQAADDSSRALQMWSRQPQRTSPTGSRELECAGPINASAQTAHSEASHCASVSATASQTSNYTTGPEHWNPRRRGDAEENGIW